MVKQRIPGTGRRTQGAGKRQSRIIEMFQKATDRASEPASQKDGFQEFSQTSQRARQMSAEELEEQDVLGQLREAAELAILQSGRTALARNPHATERMSPEELQALKKVENRQLERNYEAIRAVESTKSNIRRILESLPPEVADSDEYRAILKLTRPRSIDSDRSDFDRTTSMQGLTRTEVRIAQVRAWTERIDEQLATERTQALEDEHGDEVVGDATSVTFHQACDGLHRKRRRGDPIEEEDVELVANRSLELMQALRENVSPSWGPEIRPRWLSMGDRHVYDLALAAAPAELFRETNAWQGMQDLMRGEAVYTSRAADKMTEGVKRGD